MKTAILIHGCHLGANEWKNIVWGTPQDGIYGRASKGILLALKIHPEFVFWGTGASEKDGVREAQYIFDYAMSRAHELQYPGFSVDGDDIREFVSAISIFDTCAQNTPEETEHAMKRCREDGVERLYLVSSPTHIARCLQSAEIIRAQGGFEGLEIFATSSDTCFANSTPKDVLIVEPPHRGDRPEVPIHKTLRRAMRLGRGKLAQQFNDSLDAFLRGWERDP